LVRPCRTPTGGSNSTLPPNSEWYWRFNVLKAEILVWQHLDDQSLALNQPDLPPSLATSDLAVWRRLSQAVASAYVHRLPDARRYLDEAEAMAEAHHAELLGQVALRRGTVLFGDGAVSDAESAYHRALLLAREEKNPFLEAAALGSLGVVTAKQQHYDQSLDWNRAALQLSRSIGAESSVARVLGNMGWSFLELGDDDNALENYRQAEEAARRNGQIGDELYWRTGIAAVYHLERDYRSAEAVLKQALDQVRRQDDKSIASEYLNELSELALETGNWAAAEGVFKGSGGSCAIGWRPDRGARHHVDLWAHRRNQGALQRGGEPAPRPNHRPKSAHGATMGSGCALGHAI